MKKEKIGKIILQITIAIIFIYSILSIINFISTAENSFILNQKGYNEIWKRHETTFEKGNYEKLKMVSSYMLFLKSASEIRAITVSIILGISVIATIGILKMKKVNKIIKVVIYYIVNLALLQLIMLILFKIVNIKGFYGLTTADIFTEYNIIFVLGMIFMWLYNKVNNKEIEKV